MTNDESPQQTATLTIDQALQQAVAHHQAGQLQDAERLYRAILQVQPNHPETNHNLGILAVQTKQPAAGLSHFMTALEANPTDRQYWLSYIDALIQADLLDAARQVLALGQQQGVLGDEVDVLAGRLGSGAQVAEQPNAEFQHAYKKALPVWSAVPQNSKNPAKPDKSTGKSDPHKENNPSPEEINTLVTLFGEGRYTELATLAQAMTVRFPLHGFGWKVLGAVFKQMGRTADALMPMQKAAALSPGDAEVHYNLGNTLKDLDRLGEAEASYRRALEIKPNFALAHYNLGNIFKNLDRLDEAETSYRRALEINADFAEAHYNLGVTLMDLGRLDEAEASYRRALEIKPNYAEVHSNLGNTLKGQGRLNEAEVSYRQAREIKPDDAEAHYNLGNTLKELGRLGEAEASYRRALEIKPDFSEAYSNLGNILKDLDRLDEAEASYSRALEINPGFADAHSNLGNTFKSLGRLDEAEASYRRALEIKPDFAETHYNLGNTFNDEGLLDEARASYQRALEINPDYAEAHNNLGIILKELGRLDQAEASYRRALEIRPDYAEAHNNMGVILKDLGRLNEAETSYRRALAIKPDYAEAHNNLGVVLKDLGRLIEAEVSYRQALKLKPDFTEAHSNLGATLKDMGLLDEAESLYRRALEIKPDFEDAFGNLLFVLNYHPDKSGEEIFETYREYDAQFGLPHRTEWRPHDNNRETQRRLKVGYVSPDFKQHSVRHFLEPLLAHHDKNILEVYAYAELAREDEVSARYKSYVTHWVSTIGMDDATLAERIRADGIDILVDLAGHTARNRLGVFARKPAPVSLSWLGYGYSTGLTAIDYLLTDEASAPADSEGLFSETPWRLATPGYAYRPAEDMGATNPLPALSAGYVTFGTLSRGVRINHRVIRVWSEILKRVKGARLVIDSGSFCEAYTQDILAEKFAAHGISRDRLQIGCHSPPWDVLRGLDIGLDCFPHNSGTTLFESLYMGVPYITLAGRPSVGRIGSSILEGAGHPEWIAKTEDDYVQKAVALADDLPKLAALRAGLRQEMQAGPLMDEPAFARKVEAAYREMFEKWAKAGMTQETNTGMTDETLTIERALHQAVAHHQAGQLQDAERLYRAILQVQPNHPEANHNLGVLAVQTKQPAAGLPHFMTALEANPTHKQYWLSYIDALIQADLLDAARQVLALGQQQGVLGDGIEALAVPLEGGTQAAEQPNAEHQHAAKESLPVSSAVPQHSKQKPKPAKPDKSAGKSVPHQGNNPSPQEINTLVTLFNEERYAEVATLAKKMTEHFPLHGFGWMVLGAVFKQMGRSLDALLPMQKAAALLPGDVDAHSNLGITLQNLGRLDEAEASCRRALQIKPDHAEAHNNLGNILEDLGRLDEAEASYRRALEIKPDYAKAHNNLGNTLRVLGRLDEAEVSCRRALQIKPDYAEAHNTLGGTLHDLGRLDEAEASYRRALEITPDFAEAHYNLGNTLKDLGRLDEAEASYSRTLEIKPDLAEAHSNLGNILQELGRLNEAEASCLRALEIKPDFAEAHYNLGTTLNDLDRLNEAKDSYQRALLIKPDYAEAHNNLGATLKDLGRLNEAEASYRRALQIKPDYASARQNLATLFAYLSDFDQVVMESDAALRLKPNDALLWEQRLYAFSYHPDLSAQEIYNEFVRWGDRFPDPVVDFSTHDRTPGRRLRIGYVSPDFRRHTSRFFFWPLFANHDPAAVELYAYSNVKLEDDVTQEFKGLFDHWRNIRGVADSDVARMIRRDGIDILVDCCNHMRDDRLGVFTLKPAPIQATWLGAAWTTGLKMVDYALIDPYMAPEGTLTRETIIRLPHCFVAYRPPEQTAEIAPPPCLNNGYITFGYTGRTERLNHHTFRVWGEILRQNPTAQLILDFGPFADPLTQAHYRQLMARHGMDADRVIMRKSANIFAGLNDIDILLDCFPHSGGTMLFDALWMGVPILTLASRPPVGRIGTSLMINLGLPEWVAESQEQYISKASALAQNYKTLAQLRAGMRERMQNSPVMDGLGFARAMEAAYREMFEKWTKAGMNQENNPSHQEINTLATLFNEGRYTEAATLAQTMTVRFPLHGFGWKVLGAVFQQMGRTGDTLVPLQKAAALSPGDDETHYNLGNALKDLGRLTEAEASYRRALAINPNDADAHYNLGNTLKNLGRLDEAEASYRHVLQIKPDYVAAHNNLGVILYDRGRANEAEASYRRALAINPNYTEAHSNLGSTLKDLGRLDEAEASYRQALAISQGYAEAHSNLGITLHELGRLDEAVASYLQVLQINPDYAEAHSNLGNTLQELGRLNEAEMSYRRALQINPDYADAHYNLGATLHKLGRLEEAVVSYQRALEIKSNFAEAHYNLGHTFQELGRLNEAEMNYRRALKIKPDFAEAHYNLGHTLCDLDDLDQAAVAYQKALDIDPGNIGLDAAVYLAILYYLNGNIEQSRSKLLSSQSVMAKTGSKHNNVRTYWYFLDKLLTWHQQSNQQDNQTQGMETLYVIGESHSLPAHGVVVRYNEQEMRCAAKWIGGCKQWHLGNGKANKYKHKFEAVMERLPRDSTILLFIGEIDCRHDEGIIKASKKYPDKALAEVVQTTIASYLTYVAAIGGRYGHKIIVAGVPCTNIPLDTLTATSTEQLVQLIRIFNTTLHKLALAAGMDFLDVYTLTDRGDGLASGEWHIDGHHLLPSAVVEAFDIHCL